MLPYASLQRLALDLGIAAIGVSRARAVEEARPHLEAWLAAGYHGEMAYMQRNLDKRLDPRLLVPGAKSIVSILVPYDPHPLTQPGPRIASYAYGPDYHKTLKNTLFSLWKRINDLIGPSQGRAFVDSAPLLDRFWAFNAGLGWIGRNTLLINPSLGSYFFIGSLVLDAELEPTEQRMRPRCGSCHRCLDSCPTKALRPGYILEACNCISYLTIERKTPLAEQETQAVRPWLFGCDVCQEVCPWNLRRLRQIQGRPLPQPLQTALIHFAHGEDALPQESPLRRANPTELRHRLEAFGQPSTPSDL